MRRFLVLYATREGHTRRIAEHLANTLRSRGLSPDLVDAARVRADISLHEYCGAIIAASVHKQQHEREILTFIKRHVSELKRIPTAFLSVSLSEAGAENSAKPIADRTEAAKDVRRMIDSFLADTGWNPSVIQAAAGALMYSKYNFLLRTIMKRIARQAGGDTDTSKDYIYTDWKRLDELVDEVMSLIHSATGAAKPA